MSQNMEFLFDLIDSGVHIIVIEEGRSSLFTHGVNIDTDFLSCIYSVAPYLIFNSV